jgi:hypothetical protein
LQQLNPSAPNTIKLPFDLVIPPAWRLAVEALDNSITAGVKTDLRVYLEPPVPPLPPAGGTLVDPVFGTTIMRVTDEADTTSAGTAYSYWPSFNKNSTQLMAHYADGSLLIYQFDPNAFRLGSKHIVDAPPASEGGFGVTTFEDAIWSGNYPDKFFVHRGAALFAYDVARHRYAKVFDLTSDLPAGYYFFQMSRSIDDDLFAFTLRDAKYQVAGYLAYQLSTRRILHQARVKKLDEVQLDKMGRYLVVKTGEQGRGAIEVEVIDLRTGRTEALRDDAPDYAPGHSDNGTGIVIGGENWTPRWLGRQLATPHQSYTVLDSRGVWDNDGHVSMLADNEDWALLSLFGTAKSGLFRREILQVTTDGSQRLRRLAHHYSIFRNYQDTPRANISRDGRFIAFSSNWGGRARQDLFVLRITPALALLSQSSVSRARTGGL